MNTKKLETAFRVMYAYQKAKVKEDDIDRFEAEFNPGNVDWSDEDTACDAFCALVNELYDAREDVDQLLDNSGVTPSMLDELGLL